MKRPGLLIAILTLVALASTLVACTTHNGLAPAMVDGSLSGCIEWAQKNGDTELEAICKAGRPVTEILDLFAARSAVKDGGAE